MIRLKKNAKKNENKTNMLNVKEKNTQSDLEIFKVHSINYPRKQEIKISR